MKKVQIYQESEKQISYTQNLKKKTLVTQNSIKIDSN